MNTQIRPATAGDLDTLVALMRDFYREDGDPFDAGASRAAFAALLAESSWGRVLVAEEDGTAVGYVALTLGFSLEFGGHDAFVDDLYVAPAHRGRGFGTALLAACEETCRKLGVRALHLAVKPSNRAAVLYGRRGFRDRPHRLMTKPLDDER
jgi:GNAT superfamily N-acetyltransferase